MSEAIILDSFQTSNGRIFIIDFLNDEYSPRLGGKLQYENLSYYIRPHGMGKHQYYVSEKTVYPRDVWSCILENTLDKTKIAEIPSGTKVRVEL